MKLRVLARITLLIFDSEQDIWVEIATYGLDQPVIRIGRNHDCEIRVYHKVYHDVCRAVSRYHATLYYYGGESSDYWIQDGKPGEISSDNPKPEPLLSRLGVCINDARRKLAKGEKYLLKHRDEFHLIANKLKFIYVREHKTISEQLIEDTLIPPEYFQ